MCGVQTYESVFRGVVHPAGLQKSVEFEAIRKQKQLSTWANSRLAEGSLFALNSSLQTVPQ